MKANVTATVKQAAMILTAGLLFFTSCKKDNISDQPANSISEEEAVDVMTAGISAQSGGLAEQTRNAAQMVATETARIQCGQTIDADYTGQNQPGAPITYNYELHSSRSLVCNTGIPQAFNFIFKGHTVYSTPRLSSDDSTTASFMITGFQPGSSVYTFNQHYERNGSQQSKVGQQRSFTSKLAINATEVKVDKVTQHIISGTATLQFAGTVSGAADVSYSATLTFLGDRKGLLTFGNGNTYNIQW